MTKNPRLLLESNRAALNRLRRMYRNVHLIRGNYFSRLTVPRVLRVGVVALSDSIYLVCDSFSAIFRGIRGRKPLSEGRQVEKRRHGLEAASESAS